MKKIFLFLLAGLSLKLAQAQNGNCNNGFFPTTQRKTIEVTHYDRKDKVSMVVKNQLERVQTNSQGMEVFFKSESYNHRGKLMFKADYTVKCKNETFYVDARNWAGPSMAQQNAPDMETTISGEGVPYPNNMTVGQRLPDAEVEIKSTLKGSPVALMTFRAKITDRVVEGKETIQTPAGTFECFKLTYKGDIKVSFVKQNLNYVEYIAKNVGVVKLEAFDKNGKREHYQILTKFE